jgi:hypothetical protein
MSAEIQVHPTWCSLPIGHDGPCWPAPPGTPEQQARDLAILTAYNAGEAVSDIAYRHGLHVEVIRNVLSRALAQRQRRVDAERRGT